MGRNFYIIIKGTVSILLKKKGLEQNPDEKFTKTNNDQEKDEAKDEVAMEKGKKVGLLRKILMYENSNEPLLKKDILEIPDEDFFTIRYPSFFLMRKTGNGESFGEIALRQNVPRFFL